MRNSPQSTDLRFKSGWIEHTQLPPHDAVYTSTSEPFAFGVSFTGHRGAVLTISGNTAHARSFRPSTIGLNGPRALTWLQVEEPSEGVEVHPSTRLLEKVATLTRCRWDDLESFRQVPKDEVIWGTCAAFRAAALQRRAISEAAAEAMISNLTMHIAVHHLGGRAPRAFAGRLDPGILDRVGSYLRRHSDRVVTLSEIASVAVMSPYHFHRSFRRTVGMTPAAFAMALRPSARTRSRGGRSGWIERDRALRGERTVCARSTRSPRPRSLRQHLHGWAGLRHRCSTRCRQPRRPPRRDAGSALASVWSISRRRCRTSLPYPARA